MNTDPIRDQLWASVYAEHVRKGLIWFEAQKQADLAVQAYDKRPATEGPAPCAQGIAPAGGIGGERV